MSSRKEGKRAKELKRLEGHTEELATAAFSPDGKKIATAGWGRTVRVWTLK